MHDALYDQPGVFVWSLKEDPETGKAALKRTTLALATSVASARRPRPRPPRPLLEATRRQAAEAKKEEAKPDAAPAPAAANSDQIPCSTARPSASGRKLLRRRGRVFINEDGNLEFGFGAVITGVHWGEAPPATSNYEISLEAMKLDGNDFFVASPFR